MFRSDAAYGCLQEINYEKLLLCSDDSQSSAVEQAYPSWPDIQKVNLREVVRSTKRIVAGSAAFRLDTNMATGMATALSTDGPPLKSFIFSLKEPSRRFEEYAKQILMALWHVVHTFPGTSLHKRVAVLAPDDHFCLKLQPLLQQRLKDEMPHRNLSLMDFKESLSSLPEQLQAAGPEPKEHLILDSMGNAEGLEQLVVICVGLDAPIRSSSVDLETRAQLYKALTRAQMLSIIVNEHVEGGWLEFLGTSGALLPFLFGGFLIEAENLQKGYPYH